MNNTIKLIIGVVLILIGLLAYGLSQLGLFGLGINLFLILIAMIFLLAAIPFIYKGVEGLV